MNKTSRFLIIMLSCALLVTVGLLFVKKDSPVRDLLPVDNNADEWDGDQNLPQGKAESATIAIPGYDTLTFDCGSTAQKVNFYNPEDNTCLLKLTLFVDGAQYWQSEYIEPGKGYYDINLDQVLDKGEYEAYLMTECFTRDGTALNNAKVEFKVKAEEI